MLAVWNKIQNATDEKITTRIHFIIIIVVVVGCYCNIRIISVGAAGSGRDFLLRLTVNKNVGSATGSRCDQVPTRRTIRHDGPKVIFFCACDEKKSASGKQMHMRRTFCKFHDKRRRNSHQVIFHSDIIV